MKRWMFPSLVGVAATAGILVFLFPSLVLDLAGLLPASLPTPPPGFDARREGVERGRVEAVEYASQAAGSTRKMCVYCPPGMSQDRRYPVLYLLHGSLADETSWVNDGRADVILDNLLADWKAVPMIVVMPDGNLPSAAGADLFEADLLGDVIPSVEARFPARADRDHRALAGVSSGAHQVLALGLAHPETFASLGAFLGGLQNSEQFEKEHQDSLKTLESNRQLKLLWLANSRNDLTYEYCQDALRPFDRYGIRYTYREAKGPHTWETARSALFAFVQLLFRDADQSRPDRRAYLAPRNSSGANTQRWFFQLGHVCPPLPSR